jgi:site-specific DNA-methyltransferase (adenine-specific)
MGNMRLMQGDCLDRMKEIEDGSVDMVMCDPPYGTTACKWDSVIPLEPMWEQLNRIIKPNGAIVLFGSEPFSSALRMSNIKNYKYDWIWDKVQGSGMTISKIQPMKSHEIISVFSNKKTNYFPIMVKRDKELNTKGWKMSKLNSENGNFSSKSVKETQKIYKEKYPTTILQHHKSAKECNNTKRVHPTQKPVALMEYLIKTYTNQSEIVLDFTMGSGTTGVACENLDRNFIGIERDADYFKIAKRRIEDAQRRLL